MDPDSEMR